MMTAISQSHRTLKRIRVVYIKMSFGSEKIIILFLRIQIFKSLKTSEFFLYLKSEKMEI